MIHKRRIAKTAVISIVAEFLNKSFPIVVLYYVLRQIGLETFGEAQFSITLMEVSIPFIVFGYNIYGTILIGKYKDDKKKVSETITDIIACKLIHAFVALIGIMIFLYFSPQHQSYIPAVFAICFLLFFSAFELSWVQMGLQKMAYFSVMQTVSKIPAFLGIFLLVKSPEDGLIYAVLLLSANALCCLLTSIHIFSIYKPASFRLSRLKPMFKRSIGFAVGLVIAGTLERTDILISEFIGGKTGIGIYAGQARLVHSLNQIFVVVGSTFFSELVSVDGEKSYNQHNDLGVWVLLSIYFPIALGSLLVGPELVTTVLGSEYASNANLFQILVFGLLPNILIFIFAWQVLFINKQTTKVTIAMIAAAVSLVSLSFLLGYRFEQVGIALGSVIGRAIGAAILMFFGFKYFKIRIKTVFNALAPAFGMWGVLVFIDSTHLVLNIGLGAMTVLLFHFVINFKYIKNTVQRLRA